MLREHRYVVIKISDMENCLNHAEQLALDSICKEAARYQDFAKKPPLECVAVESDWPEYEPTWEAIAQRVDVNTKSEVTKLEQEFANEKQ